MTFHLNLITFFILLIDYLSQEKWSGTEIIMNSWSRSVKVV